MGIESATRKPVAVWRSIWYHKNEDGSITKTIGPWQKNIIVDDCYTLQAITLKNDMPGLQYMAFGSGDVSWDPIPPSPSSTDSTLFAEVFRYELQPADFEYVDASLAIVPGPERRIQVTGVLDYGDAIGQYIREFALFGGNATAAPDSGYMVNVIRAERFMKTGAIRLEREVVLGMGLA